MKMATRGNRDRVAVSFEPVPGTRLEGMGVLGEPAAASRPAAAPDGIARRRGHWSKGLDHHARVVAIPGARSWKMGLDGEGPHIGLQGRRIRAGGAHPEEVELVATVPGALRTHLQESDSADAQRPHEWLAKRADAGEHRGLVQLIARMPAWYPAACAAARKGDESAQRAIAGLDSADEATERTWRACASYVLDEVEVYDQQVDAPLTKKASKATVANRKLQKELRLMGVPASASGYAGIPAGNELTPDAAAAEVELWRKHDAGVARAFFGSAGAEFLDRFGFRQAMTPEAGLSLEEYRHLERSWPFRGSVDAPLAPARRLWEAVLLVAAVDPADRDLPPDTIRVGDVVLVTNDRTDPNHPFRTSRRSTILAAVVGLVSTAAGPQALVRKRERWSDGGVWPGNPDTVAISVDCLHFVCRGIAWTHEHRAEGGYAYIPRPWTNDEWSSMRLREEENGGGLQRTLRYSRGAGLPSVGPPRPPGLSALRLTAEVRPSSRRIAPRTLINAKGVRLLLEGRPIREDWIGDPVRTLSKMQKCRSAWGIVYTEGRYKDVPFGCGQRVCPSCMRRKAAARVKQWERHLERLARRGYTLLHVTLTQRHLPSFGRPVVLNEDELHWRVDPSVTVAETEGFDVPGESLPAFLSRFHDTCRYMWNVASDSKQFWQSSVVACLYGTEWTGFVEEEGGRRLRYHVHRHMLVALPPKETFDMRFEKGSRWAEGGWWAVFVKHYLDAAEQISWERAQEYVANASANGHPLPFELEHGETAVCNEHRVSRTGLRPAEKPQLARVIAKDGKFFGDVNSALKEVIKYCYKPAELTDAQIMASMVALKGLKTHDTAGMIHGQSKVSQAYLRMASVDEALWDSVLAQQEVPVERRAIARDLAEIERDIRIEDREQAAGVVYVEEAHNEGHGSEEEVQSAHRKSSNTRNDRAHRKPTESSTGRTPPGSAPMTAERGRPTPRIRHAGRTWVPLTRSALFKIVDAEPSARLTCVLRSRMPRDFSDFGDIPGLISGSRQMCRRDYYETVTSSPMEIDGELICKDILSWICRQDA